MASTSLESDSDDTEAEHAQHGSLPGWITELHRSSCRAAKREVLLRVLDLWKNTVHTAIAEWIQQHWRPIERCHSCHWVGHAPQAIMCPACGTMNVLSRIMHPRQKCHHCEWTRHPDFCQECPRCGSEQCLSLLQVRKLYLE